MKEEQSSEDKLENTWIAMIGLVASTLVIFILVLIFIVPINSEKVTLASDDQSLNVYLLEVSDEHLVFKNFSNFYSIDSIPDSLVHYIFTHLNKHTKYIIKMSFSTTNSLSKGTDYDNAYALGKVAIAMLVKAEIPIENIRLRIMEDSSLKKESDQTLIEIVSDKFDGKIEKKLPI